MFIPGEHGNMKFQKWPFIFKDYGWCGIAMLSIRFTTKTFRASNKLIFSDIFTKMSHDFLILSRLVTGISCLFAHFDIEWDGRCGPPNAFILYYPYKKRITLAVTFKESQRCRLILVFVYISCSHLGLSGVVGRYPF